MTRPFQNLRDQGGNKVFGIRPDLSMSYAWSVGIPEAVELVTSAYTISSYISGPYTVSGNAKMPDGEYIVIRGGLAYFSAMNINTGTLYGLVNYSDVDDVVGGQDFSAFPSDIEYIALYENKMWIEYENKFGSYRRKIAYYNIPAVGTITLANQAGVLDAHDIFKTHVPSSVATFSSATFQMGNFQNPMSPGRTKAFATDNGLLLTIAGVWGSSLENNGDIIVVANSTSQVLVNTVTNATYTLGGVSVRDVQGFHVFASNKSVWWSESTINVSTNASVQYTIKYCDLTSVATVKSLVSPFAANWHYAYDSRLLLSYVNAYGSNYVTLTPNATSTLVADYVSSAIAYGSNRKFPRSFVGSSNILAEGDFADNYQWGVYGRSAAVLPDEQTPWTFNPSGDPAGTAPVLKQLLPANFTGFTASGSTMHPTAAGNPMFWIGTTIYKIA